MIDDLIKRLRVTGHIDYKLLDEAADEIELLRGRIKIQPLNWYTRSNGFSRTCHVADSILGRYEIDGNELPHEKIHYFAHSSFGYRAICGDLNEAKHEVQKDYETRIRAVIEGPTNG